MSEQPPRMKDLTPAREALEKLAAQGTAANVALYLHVHDFRGQKAKLESCSVAAFLRHETGGDVRVLTAYIRVGNGLVPLPDPVQDFASRFDHGEFPELDLDAVVATAGASLRGGAR